MNRRTFLAALIVAPVVLPTRPVVAGGWAVVRLSEPIPPVFAGEPIIVRFSIFPHDRKELALPGLPCSITLKSRATQETTRVSSPAEKTDDPVYEIDLLIDEPGAYKWNIQAEPFPPTAMPTLHVLATGSEPATPIPTLPTGRISAEVTASGQAFAPRQVTVAAGEAVRWTNDDHMAHQVAWHDLQLDDSALIEPGESLAVTFDTPGTFSYYCGPHPWMTGEVVVTGKEEATPQL